MPISVAVIAESDSYLTWGVGTALALPEVAGVTAHLVRSPSNPSAEQQSAALRGTPLGSVTLAPVGPGRIARTVQQERPDVVVLASTGPTADVVQRALARGPHRPVLLAGIPGIALPARPRAWTLRAAVDLFVVHSHREVGAYTAARDAVGATGLVGLASLPHLAVASRRVGALRRVAEARRPAEGPERDAVVFATQAKVPRGRSEREAVLLALAGLAADRPDLRVIVKTRGRAGEFHTHYEALPYEDLWEGLVARGAVERTALTFAAGPMPEQLAGAAGFVTVSSTAALEAMAADVPLLLLDDFGVGPDLINEAFTGSGVMAGLDALRAGRFATPDPAWRTANYFHPAGDNTVGTALAALLDDARAGALPPLAARMAAVAARRDVRRRLLRQGADRLRLTGWGAGLSRRRATRRRRLQA